MISVVICTRDRAAKLERCLRHMRETWRDAGLVWQLVVVDNASGDGTGAVIDRLGGDLPLEHAYEPRPGLAHARNRGIAAAAHPIVAFTDDDCLVGPDWARSIVGEFARHPELSVLGGRVELADADDARVSVRLHDEAQRITTIEQVVTMMSGCNLAFRREVFAAVGPFDPAFGKGKRIGSAEDTDFVYRALKRGCAIAYSPDVLVRHAHGRNTEAALDGLARDYIRGRGAFYCKHVGDRQVAKMAYWEVLGLFREWLRLPMGSGSPKVLRSLAAGAVYRCVDGALGGAARAVHRWTD